MMTPRSFLYSRQHAAPPPTSHPSSSPSTPSKLSSQKRKDGPTTKTVYPPETTDFTITTPNEIMAKRKTSDRLSPPSSSLPSATATTAVARRPVTPTSAVQIPVKPKQATAHSQTSRHHHAKRMHGDGQAARSARHSPDSIPPSVAALLAITNIPPPPSRRGSLRQRHGKEARMTVDSIVPRSQVSEKELSQELSLGSSLERGPLELLLSPPEELGEEDCSIISDSALNSTISTRDGSYDSLASLGDSFATGTISSIETPYTPRRRRSQPTRRSLEPVTSPEDEEDHPLSVNGNLEKLDFRAYSEELPAEGKRRPSAFIPFKSAFKSNLTASLKALRSAARSISSLTAPSIPPEDFLTRSILTIDPRVPFTDERRPPVLEEEPTAAMRRYLNPTSGARIDRPASPVRSFTASIQMQTYKVQRSRSAPPASGRQATPPSTPTTKQQSPLLFPVGPRQREIRENSDFIRIAVMEHLMRKRGKLDDQREGHARWLLPPRKLSTRPYEIGADGVPARWVAITNDVV